MVEAGSVVVSVVLFGVLDAIVVTVLETVVLVTKDVVVLVVDVSVCSSHFTARRVRPLTL